MLFLNQIDCLPTLDLMTIIPCLRLDMVGGIDNMPKSGEEAIATSSIGIPPATFSVGMTKKSHG